MRIARTLGKLAPPLPDRRAQLLALVQRWAVTEGRTDSPYPGLTFWRFAATEECTRSCANGVMLSVVVQGRKEVRFGKRTLHAEVMDTLVFTRQSSFHSLAVIAAKGKPFLSVSLTFPADVIVKSLAALTDVGAEPPRADVPAFMARLDEPLADSLLRLLTALEDPVEQQLLVPLIVEECALRLLRSELATAFRGALGSDGDALKIQQAMQLMQQHRGRALSVPAVARQVGMSPSHFAHRFRQLARVSPMRYLRHTRLGQARALMLAEGARPSEAAARVGFASTSHFTREFKRLYGAAPAAYVRRLRR
jgi:AraC-like DNA-binding protein